MRLPIGGCLSMRRMNASASLPLAGVRVVEFCQVASGPFCGMLLADFGADVIKVEPPEGDAMRQWPPLTGGFSENFASVNRGKRSLVLNLKDEADLAVARQLVLDSDVLVENSRPGAMQRLGLGWDWFGARKPSLVYCSISAFGQDGPRGGEGGFDLTIQAAAGVMSVTGEPDGAPVKAGVPLSDFASGLYAAYSITALLKRVQGGGPGGHIDVPMFGATLAISALQTSEYFGTGRNPRKLGSAHPRNAPYQAFRAQDGYFAIAAGNHKLWLQVCRIVDQPAAGARPALCHAHAARAAPGRIESAAGSPLRHPTGRALAGRLRRRRRARRADQRLRRSAGRPAGRAPAAGASDDAARRPRHAHRGQPRAPGWPAPGRGHARAGAGPAHRRDQARTAMNPALDPIAPLRDFVVAMTGLVQRTADEPALLAEARQHLATLLADDRWLPDACAAARPDTYAQYLLHCDPLQRFSVVSFVWGPGHHTPVHDHTVWGLVGVLRGQERCDEFDLQAGQPVANGRSHVMTARQIEAVSPTLGDWHRVSNARTDGPSISIHVYGGNIGAVRRHRLDDAGPCDRFRLGLQRGHGAQPVGPVGRRSDRLNTG